MIMQIPLRNARGTNAKIAMCKQKSDWNGIFLLFDGLPPTVIESQVLCHVRSMADAEVLMEVWAFAVTKPAYEHGLHALPRLLQDHAIRIRLFRGVKPALPFSRQLNALLLLGWLLRKKCRPNFIHARTEYSAAVAATIKRLLKFRLIWDARGDTLSEFEDTASRMRMPYRWFAPIKHHAIQKRLDIAARECDRAIFVSESLRELQGEKLPSKKTIVVPCLADERFFYFDSVLRSEARVRLGYNEEHIVLLYSGSTAAWQCVSETIELMNQAIESDPRCLALVVTSQREVFERLIPKHLRMQYTITSCSLREMNGFLNAADIGVLLRKNNSINWVASPVKFAEYSLSGLQVVTTNAVQQVQSFGKLIGNLIAPDDINGLHTRVKCSSIDRINRAQCAVKICGRHFYINKIKEIYDL